MSEPDPETLADVPVGSRAVVGTIRCERAIRVRLLEMGLVPGTEVSVTRRAPLGDPIELSIRGYSLSIRKAEARGVAVTKVSKQ